MYMLNQFRGFISYTEDEFKKLWKEAIFVLDTNVLLYFYKYTTQQSADLLLSVLKNLKDEERLWIPHQVALEYFFNYENLMTDKENVLKDLNKKLSAVKEEATKVLKQVKSDHSYIKTEEYEFFVEQLADAIEELDKKIDEDINSLPNPEALHNKILELLKDIVGEPYSQEKINEIEKEGKERYRKNMPPGFEDQKDKQDFRSYGDISYQRLYGDLIVWKQILDRASDSSNQVPVIFITEEKKKDWWEVEDRKIKNPQPHLIQEFYEKTEKNFYMYRIDNFVKRAIDYLNIEVTDSQAKEVYDELESIRVAEEIMKPGESINLRVENLDKKFSDFKHENLDNRNYYEILSDSKISIKEILDYLPYNERDQGKTLIKRALHDSDPGFTYSEAILQIIDKAMPYLENKAKDLNTEIAINRNAEAANNFLNEYHSLPDDTVERGVGLLQLINRMEFFNFDELPF